MATSAPVRLVGYQVQFEPFPPFQVGRAPRGPKGAADGIIAAHIRPQGVSNVMVVPGGLTEARTFEKVLLGEVWALRLGEGGTQVVLGAGMEDPSAVGRFSPAASCSSGWKIETESYEVGWPEGYVLKSTAPDAPWPFGYHGFGERAGDMIMLRGPLRGAKQVPAPPDLVGQGQEILDQDMSSKTPWLELRYEYQGVAWRQRHFYAVLAPETVVLVTTQSPEARSSRVAKDGEAIASSIRPRSS